MNGRKSTGLTVIFVLSVSLIAVSFTAVFLTNYYSHMQFQMMGSICQGVMEERPETTQTILEILKEHKNQQTVQEDENILRTLGYRESDFFKFPQRYIVLLAVCGFVIGGFLFLFAFWYWHRKEALHIKALTGYLEKVNMGRQEVLLEVSEDDFSRLQDEIYKTVTTLSQTKDAALEAKSNFAENLSNIAHQLKTPITAISLSTQMMKEYPSLEYLEQIQKQLRRLTHLEEALLLLSRIDAGTLALELKAVDVFTVLTLAADNLQELFVQAGVSLDIPDMGEIEMTADLDWTMEAIMNLLKNCMEHTPAGKTVHCSYEQNPLYIQIRIWDEGQGFAKKDLPHLFERFYRGQNAKDGGIGIGLSLAKAIIEMQNGIISAGNIPNGGACFEIRMYSH
ncbi:signal transduction histidine kinase [Anaerotaenia torta]|uniref:sensor histidine kinase n=1 Tax=Anaerotaenia torta TaxID=433293 RepID=UPI003D1D6D7D